MQRSNPILLPESFVCRGGPRGGPEARGRMTRRTSQSKTRGGAPRGSAVPGAAPGGNGERREDTQPGAAQGDIGFQSVGAAFLVVDRAGWVLRSNGWEEVLNAPTPARIPAAG